MGKSAIVLAAGLGTRMKSKLHKVLHPVCGKPMILHILDTLAQLELDQVIVVVGQQRESVEEVIAGRAEVAVQVEQLGTGHAVQSALPLLRSDSDTTVVLYGDAPLIQAETIRQLMDERERNNAAVCVLTAEVANPTGLGRVLLDDAGFVDRVVEEKDASPAEKQIRLINTGIYSFRTADLVQAVGELKADNAQGEYYLTDTLAILRSRGADAVPVQVADAEEIASVNDRVQLAAVEAILRRRINETWMRSGVTLLDPEHTYIGVDVEIGPDTVVYPGTLLQGRVVIGAGCEIGPHTQLRNVRVGDGARIVQSVIQDSDVGAGAQVGPFAHIRPGSAVGPEVKVGNFVELKNSQIGAGAKVSHLAYVGDAEIGERVNFSCGAITVNYDGESKYRTVIGDDSFIGCNVNLVAPVTVGEGAYLCAGSTITEDVPADGFAIARGRQVTKPEYVRAWRAKRATRTKGPQEEA